MLALTDVRTAAALAVGLLLVTSWRRPDAPTRGWYVRRRAALTRHHVGVDRPPLRPTLPGLWGGLTRTVPTGSVAAGGGVAARRRGRRAPSPLPWLDFASTAWPTNTSRRSVCSRPSASTAVVRATVPRSTRCLRRQPAPSGEGHPPRTWWAAGCVPTGGRTAPARLCLGRHGDRAVGQHGQVHLCPALLPPAHAGRTSPLGCGAARRPCGSGCCGAGGRAFGCPTPRRATGVRTTL